MAYRSRVAILSIGYISAMEPGSCNAIYIDNVTCVSVRSFEELLDVD